MNQINLQAKLTQAVLLGTSMALATNLHQAQALPIDQTNQSQEQILEQINYYNKQKSSMTQVTSVSQLRDVSPTDWAYEALRSLVERYGCIVGYPDRTFRGNRALSRYEFAAGLNACMQQMERLLAQSMAFLQEDLELLKRLAQEFETELAYLGARVDNLEARVAYLEDYQFSTTTKLTGEAVIAVSGIASGERDRGTRSIEQVPVLGYRSRIELNTSFVGEDLLYTRLATGNFEEFAEVAGTDQANLAFAQPDDNIVAVEVLNYNVPIFDEIYLWAEAAGGAFDDFTNTLNILDGDGGSGALSVFGTRNVVYYQGEGSGLAFQGTNGDFEWSLGYLASLANSPEQGEGLFNGPYAVLGQLGYNPTDNFSVAFTYNNGYNTLSAGTNSRSFDSFLGVEGDLVDTIHNTYSLTMSWQIIDNFVFGAWGGYIDSSTLNSFETEDEGVFSRGSQESWYWAVSLGFPDVFSEGSMAGIIVGMPPWTTRNTAVPVGSRRERDDESVHVEAFYEYAISDNIAITPGMIVVTQPGNDFKNAALVIGTIRTTFTF